MSKKLIVLSGISGSGKSTYAHEMWLKNPLTTSIVNRDSIRNLLFGFTEMSVKDYYSRPDLGKLEKEVTLYEDTLIHEGLNLNKTVIVDATHLSKKYLERFQFWNVPIEYKYFDITLGGAIGRDSARNRKVGAEVINKQYGSYSNLERVPDFEPINFFNNNLLPPCITVDIDGTIAEKGNRSPFDWKRVGEDKPISNVTALVEEVYNTDAVISPLIFMVSGRDESCRLETEKWLKNHRIPYDRLIMRKEGDSRADWVIKEEIWRILTKDFYIEYQIDDRNQVVRRARALGLKVFQVEYGNF